MTDSIWVRRGDTGERCISQSCTAGGAGKVDVVTNAPGAFRNTAGAQPPLIFSITQPAAIADADIASSAQFGVFGGIDELFADFEDNSITISTDAKFLPSNLSLTSVNGAGEHWDGEPGAGTA